MEQRRDFEKKRVAMKSRVTRILAISSFGGILLFAGCESRVSNESEIPLNREKLDLLGSITGSLDRAANAVEKARSEREEGAKRKTSFDLSSQLLEDSLSGKEDPLVGKMVKEIGREFCRIDYSSSGGETTGLKNDFLVVEGTVCPIYFSSRVEKKVQGLKENIDFEYKYQALDSGYRQLNDVDQVHLSGLVSSREDRGERRSTGFFGGSIRSQKMGDFFLKMESSVKALSQGEAVKLVISIRSNELQAKAVIEAFVDGQGEKTGARYSINGKIFEEKEFRTLLGRLLTIEWAKYFLSKLTLS
ncbi:MAG: hypothetical protein IPJ71_14755 [Bdellovibrionales bacterium]|nr:hypothetical protein [Bdellovibrionales bacterium]